MEFKIENNKEIEILKLGNDGVIYMNTIVLNAYKTLLDGDHIDSDMIETRAFIGDGFMRTDRVCIANEYAVNYDCVYKVFAQLPTCAMFVLRRNGKNYNCCGHYVDGSWEFLPCGQGYNKIRVEVAERINIAVSEFLVAEGYGEFEFTKAIGHFALDKIENFEGAEEEIPNSEKPEMVEKVIERTVVKENTGVLEQMLLETITGLVSKVAVEDMVPRIKEKIINEFGIEPQIHTIIRPDNIEKQINGIVHESYDKIAFMVANNMPIYMVGPAGSGKNVLAEQVAKSLDMDFYYMNSVTDEFKITGFKDAAGNYHESEFYKAFTNGGLFFLDEMDASAPEVLVCLNAAIANGYFSFPNGAARANENFRVIAAGNTLGTGADAMYTGRMQLDAASLNRFMVVEVSYDERIDLMNAENDKNLVEFIKDYRKALKKCGLASVASYRNIKMIKLAEKAMTLEDALACALTKEMNRDDINTLMGTGEFDTNNPYAMALSNITPIEF